MISLVSFPDPSRRGLATRSTLLWPKGIQSLTWSRVNVYKHGGNWSYLHAVVLVCKLFFALLDHGTVSVLCLACGNEALHTLWVESTERYKRSNTMEDSRDRSSSCSQLLSVQIQRWRLLPPFSALATTFHNPLSLTSNLVKMPLLCQHIVD